MWLAVQAWQISRLDSMPPSGSGTRLSGYKQLTSYPASGLAATRLRRRKVQRRIRPTFEVAASGGRSVMGWSRAIGRQVTSERREATTETKGTASLERY